MKTIDKIKLAFIAAVSMSMIYGCSNNVDFDYVLPLKIEFDTKDIVQIAEGQTSYTVKGKVTSSTGLMVYAAYEADPRTGIMGEEIPGTMVQFEVSDKKMEYSFSITIDDIESNKAVKIMAIDESGTYMKNFVVKITPTVIFTDKKTVESDDYYYGSFFATWHLGRVYPLRTAKVYPHAVDISFGEVTDDYTGVTAPVVISPAKRAQYGMSTYEGVRPAKFAATDITMAEYDAIKEIDDTPLRSLSAAEDYVVIIANRVYAYETAEGKKGLLAIHSLSSGSYVYTMEISAKVQK